MSSFAIIAVILIILVISVAIITIIQKREQEKALLRQKIAQYRYRANNAINILGNFSRLPIGSEARQILLQYSLANLKAIAKLSPEDEAVRKQITQISQSIQSQNSPADKSPLEIPPDFSLLTQQINQLSTLAKFLVKLNKSNAAQASLVPVAVSKIMSLISESKICAYIQQGKDSLSKHEYVPAQKSFIMAQQMMLKITNKNERLKKLELDLLELIKSSPSKAKNTELSFNQSSNEEQQPNEEDGLFGPRKKW